MTQLPSPSGRELAARRGGIVNAVQVADAITALFVPGNRPDRYLKAAQSGADVVIIDLEDAVPADERESALAHVVSGLRVRELGVSGLGPAQEAPPVSALVRVTDLNSPTHVAEVDALLDLASGSSSHGLLGLVVPKAADPDRISVLADRLSAFPGGGLALILLVESAAGIQQLSGLAEIPGVTRLAFGALDLALDVGAEPDSEVAAYARAQLVLVSRAARIAAPLNSPSIEIRDLAVVGEAARAARRTGFGGQLCIHPAQVAAVRDAFLPSTAEVAWARSVVGAGGGAVQINGVMIDRPVLERARRILRLAGVDR